MDLETGRWLVVFRLLSTLADVSPTVVSGVWLAVVDWTEKEESSCSIAHFFVEEFDLGRELISVAHYEQKNCALENTALSGITKFLVSVCFRVEFLCSCSPLPC